MLTRRLFRAVAPVLLCAFRAVAQQGEARPPDAASNAHDFWLAREFLEELQESRTFLWTTELKLEHRSGVHDLKSDCEMHFASPGPTDSTKSWPKSVVVEPANMCKDGPEGAAPSTWTTFSDQHFVNQTCTVSGFPRLFTEHASGGTPGSSNPNHSVELHPALKIECPGKTVDFRPSLRYIDGMRTIKQTTTARCLQGRKLWLRSRARGGKAGYIFKEGGGGSCGNFAKVFVTVNPETSFLRAVGGQDGGHTLLVRATAAPNEDEVAEDFGMVTLKLYTFNGTAIDQRLTTAAAETEPTSLWVHGMLTYDYWSIVKKLTNRGSGPFRSVGAWEEIEFPLALVLFGEVEDATDPHHN